MASIAPERRTAIGHAIDQFKGGIEVNTRALGEDKEFYERVIEASKEGIIEL